MFDLKQPETLMNRIHQIKRGGLGVTLDILFRTIMIGIPSMKSFYNALLNDIDRGRGLEALHQPSGANNDI